MKVSIITPTFNSKNTLIDTFNSVRIQTYIDIQYIVVDGNSNDGTLDIIKDNLDLIDHLISEPDLGIYDAINKGIKISSGDIVGVLNSDDFYKDELVIAKIVNNFKSFNVDSVYADARYVKAFSLNKTVRFYSSKKFTLSLFRFGFMPVHPSFFVKRYFFLKYGFYELHYKIAADFELLLRFMYVNKISSKYINEDLVIMRMGGISTKSWRSNLIINKEIRKACIDNGLYTNYFFLTLKYFVKIFEFKWI